MKTTRRSLPTLQSVLVSGIFASLLFLGAPSARAQSVAGVGVSAASLGDGQSAVATVYLSAPTSGGYWVTLNGGFIVPTTQDTLGGRSGGPGIIHAAYFPSQVFIAPGQTSVSFWVTTIAGRYAGWVNIHAHYRNSNGRALIYMHP